MVENNGKGKQARRYFIDCERRLREAGPARAPAILGDELESAISQEAHALALRSFGPIRARLVQLVRYCLDGGEIRDGWASSPRFIPRRFPPRDYSTNRDLPGFKKI